MLVDRRAFVVEVVRADDRRIAPGIAAAEPTLFQHGHVADAVLLGEIVGRSKPVPAGTYDHRLVGGLRRGRAPLALPPLMGLHRLDEERSQRETAHGKPRLPAIPLREAWAPLLSAYDRSLNLFDRSVPISRPQGKRRFCTSSCRTKECRGCTPVSRSLFSQARSGLRPGNETDADARPARSEATRRGAT